MALYIPHSIFHLSRLLYVRPETFGPYYVYIDVVLRCNKTLVDDNCDSGENYGQQEGDNVDCDPTFEASCLSPEQHLSTRRGLKDLVHYLNLVKKQAELLGYRLQGWDLLHEFLKCVSFATAKINSKNFSLKKTNLYFVMIFVRYRGCWTPTRSN